MKPHEPNADFETCPAGCGAIWQPGNERPCDCDLDENHD